jgi:hypothetical protein
MNLLRCTQRCVAHCRLTAEARDAHRPVKHCPGTHP